MRSSPIGFSSLFFAGFSYGAYGAYSSSADMYQKGNSELRKVFEHMNNGESPSEDQLSNFLEAIRSGTVDAQAYSEAVAKVVPPVTRTWTEQVVDEKYNTITITKSETSVTNPDQTLEFAEDMFNGGLVCTFLAVAAGFIALSRVQEWSRYR